MLDVVVIGLGAMGSAALFHAARLGASAVGIDAFDPPHTLGSTHGDSRIIREAYFEDPSYVPLVRRAYANWADLERASGQALFRRTGGLMIGAPESGLVLGTLESARTHDIKVTALDAHAMRARFPALTPEAGMIGVLEHNAGVLDPEACVRAHLAAARARGAGVRVRCRVTGLTPEPSAIQIDIGDERLIARRVIVAAGPWTKPLLATAAVDLPLVVERQTMHWFDAGESRVAFAADHLPVTLIEHAQDRYVYFVPDMGRGVKAAIHYDGQFVDADHVPREITSNDVQPVRDLLARFAPALSESPRASAVCLYTNTPDKHFLIGDVPNAPGIFVLSACSGHGFKFASALGEIAARASLGESIPFDLARFGASRFA